MITKFCILLQVWRQHLKAAGDVEINGRRNFAQVIYRGLKHPRCRFAGIYMKCPAVSQNQIEIVVAAEGVIPGQPIDQYRRATSNERPDLSDCLLVGTHHPLRIDDTLRHSG